VEEAKEETEEEIEAAKKQNDQDRLEELERLLYEQQQRI